MLSGEIAAPCYLQSAIAGVNSYVEGAICVAALTEER